MSRNSRKRQVISLDQDNDRPLKLNNERLFFMFEKFKFPSVMGFRVDLQASSCQIS